MHKQTPEWLTNFTSAYGAKGIIALAWWIGARHAAEIRDLEGSFPFLQVEPTGSEGATLFDTLSALSGAPETPIINASTYTPTALNRTLFAKTDLPLLLSVREEPKETSFDWDQLKPLFTNCTYRSGTRFDPQPEAMKFSRGLVLLASKIDSPALRMRTVRIRVDEQIYPQEHALQLLQQLEPRSDVLSLSSHAQNRLIYQIGGTKTHIEALQDAMGNCLPHRDAKNHALLISLVSALTDIFCLPEFDRAQAVVAIYDMADKSADVPF